VLLQPCPQQDERCAPAAIKHVDVLQLYTCRRLRLRSAQAQTPPRPGGVTASEHTMWKHKLLSPAADDCQRTYTLMLVHYRRRSSMCWEAHKCLQPKGHTSHHPQRPTSVRAFEGSVFTAYVNSHSPSMLLLVRLYRLPSASLNAASLRPHHSKHHNAPRALPVYCVAAANHSFSPAYAVPVTATWTQFCGRSCMAMPSGVKCQVVITMFIQRKSLWLQVFTCICTSSHKVATK
jgi:hypothetical protein